MDFTNRVGHKMGQGGPASQTDLNVDRKERLRQMALKQIDLSKDPYIMRNSIGHFECKLCLTMHVNEGSYLSHTQGRKHQVNLARRLQKETVLNVGVTPDLPKPVIRKTVRIGRPGYRVTKMRDPKTEQRGLLFEVDYPELEGKPHHRFMSAHEQSIESPPDSRFQYLIFAAEPYESVGFKIPNQEVDRTPGHIHAEWDSRLKMYSLQFEFTKRTQKLLPGLPQRPTTFLPVSVRW